jgi:hypothetical protein
MATAEIVFLISLIFHGSFYQQHLSYDLHHIFHSYTIRCQSRGSKISLDPAKSCRTSSAFTTSRARATSGRTTLRHHPNPHNHRALRPISRAPAVVWMGLLSLLLRLRRLLHPIRSFIRITNGDLHPMMVSKSSSTLLRWIFQRWLRRSFRLRFGHQTGRLRLSLVFRTFARWRTVRVV